MEKENKNISKNGQIKKLISEKMFDIIKLNNFTKIGHNPSYFKCPNKEICKVCLGKNNPEDDSPIYAPALGSKKCEIMLIAEAPSNTLTNGLIYPSTFKDFIKELKKRFNNSPLVNLYNFFEDNYSNDKLPYFTDIIKCGVNKQTKEEKKILNTRLNICFKYMLKEEIKILKPKKIFCIGKTSFDFLTKNNKDFTDILDGIEIIHLLHYGRQANLHLRDEDKRDIIWKYQAGLIKQIDLGNYLCNLSYFKKDNYK